MECIKGWWNNRSDNSKIAFYCGFSFGVGLALGHYALKRFGYGRHKMGSKAILDYVMTTANEEVSELQDILTISRKKFGRRAGMATAVDQCYLFKWLMPIIQCEKAIEVGVFTGSSGLMIAKGMPDNGRLMAFDVSKEYTDIAQEVWKKAGVDHKISLSLDGGTKGLEGLLKDTKEHKTYDFAYVDAMKKDYDGYYEQLLPLMKTGGIMAFDNMMWKGRVAHKRVNDDTTVAIRALTQKIKKDERVEMCLITIGDGVLLLSNKFLEMVYGVTLLLLDDHLQFLLFHLS